MEEPPVNLLGYWVGRAVARALVILCYVLAGGFIAAGVGLIVVVLLSLLGVQW